jgi:thiol-disulfide isomerase/thioredoxin
MQMRLLALGAALSLLATAPSASGGPRADDVGARSAAAAPQAPPAAVGDPDSGVELIGRTAPSWSFDRWIRTAPLSLDRLRGKVVLVRWWTEGCHYCANMLPELEALRTRHAGEGLVVIGVFHPKPEPREVGDRHIVAVANRLGFGGPIAVDGHWRTLQRYWLGGHPERDWTSVSFLIDHDGIIRWVHGGGEYHRSDDPRHRRCEIQYRELEKALSAALAAGGAARIEE